MRWWLGWKLAFERRGDEVGVRVRMMVDGVEEVKTTYLKAVLVRKV